MGDQRPMPDSDMRVRTADPDSDAEAIAAIYRPAVEASAATFEERAPTITQMAARIRHVLRKTPWLVAEDASDGVIGYAYARLHHERVGYRWSVDVSAYVRPDRHGRGVGRVMYDALLPILRRQNFVNVYAGIALPNPASVALHESIGMRRIGVYERVGYKMGGWYDVAWYGMQLAEPADSPTEPIPFRRLPDES